MSDRVVAGHRFAEHGGQRPPSRADRAVRAAVLATAPERQYERSRFGGGNRHIVDLLQPAWIASVKPLEATVASAPLGPGVELEVENNVGA
jgi:hypothetical protein